MPGIKKKRCCRNLDNEVFFRPAGIPFPLLEIVELQLDEFEAIRLCDYEGKSQIETGEIMGISRGTVQRLIGSGRKKIMDAFLNLKGISIKNIYENKNKEMNTKDAKRNE